MRLKEKPESQLAPYKDDVSPLLAAWTEFADEAGVEGAAGAEEGGRGERIGGMGGVGEEEGRGRGRVVGGVSGRPNLSVYMKP